VTLHYRGAHRGSVGRSGFRTFRGSSARVGGSPERGGLADEVLG
jgi:hypothetical protein